MPYDQWKTTPPADESEPERTCRDCGDVLQDDEAIYCSYCGGQDYPEDGDDLADWPERPRGA